MSDSQFASALLPRTSGLPAPVVANPLAAITQAGEAATQAYRVRDYQAQQAVGQAYQDAIDRQTGVFSPTKFRANLAAAGPVAAMQAGAGLLNTQQISSNELDQQIKKRNIAHNILGSALTIQDPQQRDDYLVRQAGAAVRNGVFTPEEAVTFFGRLPTDPVEREQALRGAYTQTLPAEAQPSMMPGGQRITTEAGGVTYERGRDPVTGQRIGPTVTTTHGPTPAEAGEATNIPYGVDKNGRLVPPNDPSAVGQIVVQVPKGSTGFLPKPGITVEGGAGAAGGGGGQSPTPAGVVPDTASPSPGYKTPPNQPPKQAALRPPQVAAPGNAVPAPGIPSIEQPRVGTTEQIQADVKAYNDARQAVPQQRVNLTAGEAALAALRMLKSTGPGSDTTNRYASFLAQYGIHLPFTNMNDPAAYQYARKQMLAFVLQNSAGIGGVGTDYQVANVLAANANVEAMLPQANEAILTEKIGQTRQRIAQTLEAPAKGAGFNEHIGNFPVETDSRGFAWDLYDKPQRDAIIESVGGKGSEEYKILMHSVALADKYHMLRFARPQQPAAPAGQ